MFERYTENARRALFFGRYEASQLGSMTITTELLLLGTARSDKTLVRRLLGVRGTPDDIRREVERLAPSREKISTSVEIPFDASTKRVLQFAAEEADRLQHRHIGTEHLILGMLREPQSAAAAILMNCGLQLADAREAVAKLVAEDAPRSTSSEATEAAALIRALDHTLDRLSTVAADNAEARTLLDEIRERVAALERQLGPRSE
jgi:ATP-dependent Clp protease ATP-binding subunit ClpC